MLQSIARTKTFQDPFPKVQLLTSRLSSHSLITTTNNHILTFSMSSLPFRTLILIRNSTRSTSESCFSSLKTNMYGYPTTICLMKPRLYTFSKPDRCFSNLIVLPEIWCLFEEAHGREPDNPTSKSFWLYDSRKILLPST